MNQQATCHTCHTPITLANTVLLTETLLVWTCKCGVRRHSDLPEEIREAVCGPLHPRLPYQPGATAPLEGWEPLIEGFGLVMDSLRSPEDFFAYVNHRDAVVRGDDIAGDAWKAHPADGEHSS